MHQTKRWMDISITASHAREMRTRGPEEGGYVCDGVE